MEIAKRGRETGSLVDSEIVFFVNVTDWYSGLNRTGFAGTILFDSRLKLKWIGDPVRTFKPSSIMKVQVCPRLFFFLGRFVQNNILPLFMQDLQIHELFICCCFFFF